MQVVFLKNPTVDYIDFEELKMHFPEIPGYELPGKNFKIPAAWLIDQCGWKGKTFGQIGVHKKQALVLVNYGQGKGQDIKKPRDGNQRIRESQIWYRNRA